MAPAKTTYGFCRMDRIAAMKNLRSTNLVESADLGEPYAESGQTSQGLFFAVSNPILATTYSLESSRRDLHIALRATILKSQIMFRNYTKYLPNV